MWGQGQTWIKVKKDMNMREPGELRWKFQSSYFHHKRLSFDAKFDGELNGAIFIFLFCILWSKANLKILDMDISEVFGRYESDFRADWL